MERDQLELHAFGVCPHSMTARWSLMHKGLDFRSFEVPLVGRWRLRRAAGHNWPPVLVDGGRPIHHLAEIVRHLDERVPERELVPKNARLRHEAWLKIHWAERALHYLVVAVKYLDPANLEAALASHGRRGPQAILLRAVPAAQRIRLVQHGYRRDGLAAYQRRLEECFDFLDHELQGSPYLVGDRISAADMLVLGNLRTLEGCAALRCIDDRKSIGRWRDHVESEFAWAARDGCASTGGEGA